MHRLNWDDLRVFLAVARTGRFAAAATKLGIDHTTVARRISSLEAALSATLISRSPQGAVLTPQGERLLSYAERIEAEALRASEEVKDTATCLAGTVRLASPEAFGCWIVAPNVHRLAARHPALRLELVARSQKVSLSKREADIAITLNRPPRGRVVAQRLAGHRLGLYASRSYLERHPPIRSVADLKEHPIIWYIEDLLDFSELHFLHEIVGETPLGFRSNSVVAQQAAVATGAGIGVMHTFAAAQDPRLVPVLRDVVSIERSYWITIRTELRQVPRIRAVIDFLKEVVGEFPEHLDVPRRGVEPADALA